MKINWILSLLILSSLGFPEEFSRIPIRSFPFLSSQRFMQIQIEGKNYLGLIDTGSAFSFIRKDVLNGISEKLYLSDTNYISLNGNHYSTPNYRVSEVRIGDYCNETVFKEEAEHFWTDGCAISAHSFIQLWKVHLMYQVYREALLGIDLFQSFTCVFDFPHSSVILSKDASLLSENYLFQRNQFFTLPFEMGKAGVILTLNTSLGEKKLLLDSAATSSLISLSNEEKIIINEREQQDEIYTTDRMEANGYNLGAWEFKVVKIANELNDIDGILGIDFFMKNIIGFDFEHKITYIQHPLLGSKERFTYWLKSYFGLK